MVTLNYVPKTVHRDERGMEWNYYFETVENIACVGVSE